MCKEMMKQRNSILEMLNNELNRCTKSICENGRCVIPTVMVDLANMFIANREYFERQGFFFDTENIVENNQPRYCTLMKLGGNGELASLFWKKIHEAKESYVSNQRNEIFYRMRDAGGSYIYVDMKLLHYENKMFFEERGFYFEPETQIINDQYEYLARMKKRK